MLTDFFRAVLPSEGHYCLVLLPEGRHIWTEDLAELEELSLKYEGRHGVYFGTAAFMSSDNRKGVNVLALKSLRLDIDAGEKKHATDPEGTYANQRDAMLALKGFIQRTQVMPSYIVSSGEGLHVYYVLDEALTPKAWLPLAEGLANAAALAELRVDVKVTTDTARVLRPIGGLHQNGSRVSVLKDSGKVYTSEELAKAFPPPRKFDTSINDDVTLMPEGPPSSAMKIVQHCGALRKVAESKGDVPEPFWRAMLGVVKFTVEGEELAHEWSMGYDGYDERETARKLANWSTGPTTCNEFSKHCKACGTCEYQGKVKSPILLGRMTAALIEALPEEKRPAPAAPPAPKGKPWDGKIPAGFNVVGDSGRYTLVQEMEVEREDATGEAVPVVIKVPFTHEVFWFSHWADAERSGDYAILTIHKWDDMTATVKSYEMPTAALASRSDLTKHLASIGIHATTDKRALTSMDAYTKAQMLRVKNSFRRLKVLDRFGLRITDDNTLVAVHGRYAIYPDGSIREAMLGTALQPVAQWFTLPLPRSLTGEWEPTVWDEYIMPAAKRQVEFMRSHYGYEGMEQYQLAYMLSLCSPLMAFVTGSYMGGATLPANGLSVSLFEREGGKGKSTLMKAAMLAYGNPDELAKDSNGNASTDLGRMALLSQMGTMPVAFDEMGRTGEKSVANLISSIANGTARTGMTKDGGLRTGARWALTCLIATNRSQRDMVTVSEAESSAVQYRLLELDMNNIPDFDIDQRTKFTEDWNDIQSCAGALGAVIQQFVCRMGHVQANKLVMDCVARAAKLVDADQEDRFQYRALGAMLATQLILKKLGMEMFDVQAMIECFKVANDKAKSYVKETMLPTDGLELLQKMLHDMRPNTVITLERGFAKGPVERRNYASHLGARMPDRVDVRYIQNEGIAWVSTDAVKEWCVKHRIRPSDILADAEKNGIMMPVYPHAKEPKLRDNFNLLVGMRESTKVQVKCYAFKITRLGVFCGQDADDLMHHDEPTVVDIKTREAVA